MYTDTRLEVRFLYAGAVLVLLSASTCIGEVAFPHTPRQEACASAPCEEAPEGPEGTAQGTGLPEDEATGDGTDGSEDEDEDGEAGGEAGETEPQCRVGSPWTCPAHTTCVGAPGAPWDAPGTCQHAPRPRRADQLYVFFGHNSVGRDMAYALPRIEASLPEAFRILSRMPAGADRAAHIRQLTDDGANSFGNPTRQPGLLEIHYELWQTYALARQQLAHFEEQVRRISYGHTNSAGLHVPAQRLDIAAVKFCFAPFDGGADSDVDSFFEHYATQTEQLQREFPELILLHFTQATQECNGNNPAYQQVGNRRRMRFSQRMLERYGHTGRVFELARLEATDPQGNVHYCNYTDTDGSPVMGLLSQYALPGDYGHFGPTAANLIAREFAHFLENVR